MPAHDDPFLIGNPADLTVLDVACTMPLGCRGERAAPVVGATLQDVLERIFAPSMQHGRCCIPFSGGVESSMWLAAATGYARRSGQPDPVALTLRHPGLANAEHLRAQERIVGHLGLADWERIEPEGSLDLVGPLAAATLERTGPLWPPHAFTMAPLIEAARDGVFMLVTGLTDFFSWWRWAPLVAVAEGRRRPGRRDLTLLGCALMPARLRARIGGRRLRAAPMSWLTPAARREATASLCRRDAEVPRRCDHAVAVQMTHRCFAASSATLQAIGELHGTRVEQPLLAPGVTEAFAGAAGRRGYDGVGSIMRAICGDLLPTSLLSTGRGPDLRRVFFGDATRAFAASWNGTGVDESVVDVAVLRRNWLGDSPDPRTACLLQYAWLAERASTGALVSTTT